MSRRQRLLAVGAATVAIAAAFAILVPTDAQSAAIHRTTTVVGIAALLALFTLGATLWLEQVSTAN
ncbi:MAG: hypothetical protein ABEI98_01370 [Halorhabdus sp.]